MSSLVFKNSNAASVPTPAVGKTTIFVDANGNLTLKDDGGTTSFIPVGNVGSNTQVLFNDEGNIAGNSNFTWNKTSNTLTVTGNITASNANLGNTVTGNYFTGVLTYAAQPNITSVGTLQSLLVGGTSSNSDYANAKTISSQDNSGVTANDNIGLVGEAVANSSNTSITGIGLLGVARANSATKATGVQGEGHVTNTADTGAAVGVRGYAIDTHAGGYNIGVLGNAMGSGAGNYAFYVQAGGIGSIETATFWDLADNSNIALTFQSTGKSNIFGIDTTDSSEGIFTSGYLNVTGNASVGGIKTNNYYYANGSPVDFQQAGGSNTQVQFNDADGFGGSAAFTFNKTTNTVSISNALSVTGNTSAGNLSTGGVLSVTGNSNVGNLGTAGSITATGNITGGNLLGTFANGTSNIRIFNNANIAVSSAGTANVMVVTNTGVTVSNLTLSNPGVGNTTTISFLKNSDTTGLQVAEYSTDKTLYNFYINDNSWSQGSDGFMWTLGSYTATNHLAQPIYIDAGYTTRLSAANTQFYGNILQNTSRTFSTANVGGTGLASSIQIFGDVTKLPQSVAGTITITSLDMSGYTGVTGTQFWLSLTGTGDTFQWGTGWGPPGNPSPTPTQTGLSVSTSPVTLSNGMKVTFSATTGGVVGDVWSCILWTGVTNTLGPTTVTGTISVSGNANVGNLGTAGLITATGNVSGGNLTTTGALNVTGNANTGNLGTTTAIITTGNITTINSGLLQNGNSNVTITANANVTINAVGGTRITATSTGANITGTLGVSGNANVGNLGTATAIITTGNITTINSGLLQNGNSNVTITANGNVTINAVGGARITATSTGANVTGTLDVSGNATVGNLITGTGSGGNISGANVITANTFVGALSGAATTAGTVTTAAQPNITSVGTLSSLSVTANVAAGNLTTTGVLSVTGTGVSSIAGNLDMTSNNIINLATPVNANDAATKQYVDDVAQGLHTHDTCNAATTDTLAVLSGGTVTYNNGSSGVGATLTTTGSYTTIDGVTLTNGMRILVKNEANSAHNGIYDRTSSTILTRSTDFDTPTEMAGGDFTFVTSGTLYDNTGWVMTDAVTTVGTSPVPWVQFSGAGTYTAGTGLTLTGTQFSITNTAVTAGSYGNGDAVATFTVNGQGQLTAASNVSITANAGNLSGTILKSTVVTSSLTSVGNVTTGTWNSSVGASATFAAGLSGANLASITGGNVSGTVGSATNAAALLQNTSTSTTVYPTFTTSSANGNSQAVFNTSISANLGNASITATTFVGALSGAATSATTAGTVTTNAQPNITSVGTLTSLGVSGTVTASTLVSNVADGTAPLTVTSTTRVANLNVAYANVADNINVTAPGTGTGYIVFANATTGNVTEWTTAGITSNLANNSITATTFVGALSGAATTAGTVTTNAQPNITSVGTLSSVAVTGNANVGNLNSSGRVYANDNILVGSTSAEGGQITIGWVGVNNFTGQANSTWNIDVDNSNNYRVFYQNASGGTGVAITAYSANANIATNSILSNGTIGGASATLFGTTLTTGANTTAGTITGNWALSAGSRFNATYADLAERYSADADYKPGTVVVFGGNAEVTVTTESDSHRVAGVVSTNPAYLMNSGCEGEFVVDLALMGRVPVQVLGPISKGDLIVTSEIAGYGKANNLARAGTIVGKALENLSQVEGVIEVLVGRT